MSYNAHLVNYHRQAAALGVSYEDAETLRRAAMTMHRIAEHECNGVLYRCEEEGQTDHRGRPLIVGKVYAVSNINGPGPLHYYRTADREMPARDRVTAIAKRVGASVEFQGDPRGWPLTLRFPLDGRIHDLSPPCR